MDFQSGATSPLTQFICEAGLILFLFLSIVDKKYFQKALDMTLKKSVNAIEADNMGVLATCISDLLILSRFVQLRSHIPFLLYDEIWLCTTKPTPQ